MSISFLGQEQEEGLRAESDIKTDNVEFNPSPVILEPREG